MKPRTQERVVPFYACEHGVPGGCRKCSQAFKSPNVVNVLALLNCANNEIQDLNKSERAELAVYLNAMADAFKADAPEKTKVPGIDEVTMSLADIAATMIDTYGLA